MVGKILLENQLNARLKIVHLTVRKSHYIRGHQRDAGGHQVARKHQAGRPRA